MVFYTQTSSGQNFMQFSYLYPINLFVMKHSTLNQAFEKIEKERKNLYERLLTYDVVIIHTRPKPDAWSVIEVIEHLIAAEHSSLQYLLKKTQDLNGAKKTGFKERLRALSLHLFLSAPIKFKAPNMTIPVSNIATLADTQSRWEKIRTELHALWNRLPEEALDRNWFRHPLAGKLSLLQMIAFFGTHFARHEHQIWRTLKAVSAQKVK